MSGSSADNTEFDYSAFVRRRRELVSELSSSATVVAPVNGKDTSAVLAALQLAPIVSPPTEIIASFCSVNLGHRLIPVAGEDLAGTARWPTINTRLEDRDLQDAWDDNQRFQISQMLEIWSAMVEGSRGGCRQDGWIGGRMSRDRSGRTVMLWPVLHPRFSNGICEDAFDLFTAFDIQIGG